MLATLRRMGRPKKKEPTEPIRLPASLVKRIRRVALHFDLDPGDYVARAFAEQLARDEEQMFADQEKEREERKPKK